MIEIDSIRIPISEISFSYARSSGPGGQNVNKVNSKAILKWPVWMTPSLPTGVKSRFLQRYANRISQEGVLTLISDRYRDQSRNKADCVERLVSMIRAVLHPPKKRKKKRVSQAAKRKRVDNKRRQGEKKRLRQKPDH